MEEKINFFKDKIVDLTAMNNSLLQMPTMRCFNFCLEELIDLCNINSEIGNKKYFELAKDFKEFLKKDKVLKELDIAVYITLLKKLKFMIDSKDKVNSMEYFNYFQQLKITYGKKYKKKMCEMLLKNLESDNDDYEELDILIETCFNELLAKGYTYKFLNEIVIKYVYGNLFDSPNALLEFLFRKKLNYDIYIPIKNFTIKDKKFIKNSFKNQHILLGREIELKDNDIDLDVYYCHIFFKGNDYFKYINKHIKRLKSVLNFGRYYINSNVCFDYERKCIIKSDENLKIENKSLNTMLYYSYFKGTEKIIDSTMSTLKKLTGYDDIEDKDESILAKDFYNIIDYSEKDERLLTIEQFIDKWISLETLYSKASNKGGFDCVLQYLPQVLAIDLLRKKINITLKKSKFRYKSLENFVDACYGEKIDDDISMIRKVYYRRKISRFKEILINPKKLEDELNSIMEKLRMDIHRIYIYRNKYVHTGDTKAYYDLPQYFLYQMLALSIDKVLKALSDMNRVSLRRLSWDLVFTNLINKYTILFDALNIYKEDLKINNNFVVRVDDFSNKKDHVKNIIVKILLEKHIGLFEIRSIESVDKKYINIKGKKKMYRFSKL